MANGIEEIITTVYEMVQDAWSLPLGAEKCVVERDKVLDLLDEISNQLPGELKQAKTIVESRNEVITNAKREAENILKQAEQRAKQMISREEVYRQAEQEAAEMIKAAQQKIKELRQVTNDYVDDSMKRTKLEEQNHKCAYCGGEIPDMKSAQADHIVPWSKGGRTVYENLQILCVKCNAQKSNKSEVK